MKNIFPIFLALAALASQTAVQAQQPIYKNPKAPLEERVNDLFSRLTPDEKLSLLSTKGYINLCLPGAAIPRLGIPSLSSANAPQAIGGGKSTNFPMEVNMSSTWDLQLIHDDALAMGEEARAMGRQLIYGPCINIQRTPQGGRFFENFSEDPFVTSQFTVAYITGMQSQGVACCPKHYFGNDQEYGRHGWSSDMDERTMREVYLAPFHAALVDAHAWAMMTSFNRVNGTYVADSKPYVDGIVDGEYAWDGVAIGDWGSLHDTALSMNAGLDQEIASPNVYSPANVTKALAAGSITQATLDEAVKRNVRLIIRTGLADDPPSPVPPTVDSPAHRALALKTAEEGIILLKNEKDLLPLSRSKTKSIAVIGPNASDTQLGGRWSAEMTPFYFISVLDGIKNKAAPGTMVSYALGCNRTGDTPDATLQEAVALAAKSDVAIVVVGTDKDYLGEELDPPNLYLPGAQEKLIQAVAAVNKKTIVVLNNGMPLLMDRWLAGVPGLVEAWYPGQETGNAVAEILFGDVNPSGRLTCTIASRREDYSDWPNYPGTKAGDVIYAEGVLLGYRHFDKNNITPLFPFGFGLSYTKFQFRRLSLPRDIERGKAATARVFVKNTGTYSGDEVVQLYVRGPDPGLDSPIRELEGFQRVHLNPGEEKQVSIAIGADAFSHWDSTAHNWRADPGNYEIEIGSSSRDIANSGSVRLD